MFESTRAQDFFDRICGECTGEGAKRREQLRMQEDRLKQLDEEIEQANAAARIADIRLQEFRQENGKKEAYPCAKRSVV